MDLSLSDTKLSPEDMSAGQESVVEYVEHLNTVATSADYSMLESSINLPSDEKLRDHVVAAARPLRDGLKYIFVVGIGGSNLGTKAVYDALIGYHEQYGRQQVPKMFFLDTTNPSMLETVSSFVRVNVSAPEDISVCVISKSGTTTETIANTELLLTELASILGESVRERVTVITDSGSALDEQASRLGINSLTISDTVGGRFSVLSAVGLFPLTLAGIDIGDLHQGALDARDQCLSDEFDQNPALQSAIAIHHAVRSGVTIHDTFLFHPELESLGKWYRQLVGESLGKEEDKDGNKVNTGITPTVSIGSTDLHSVAQLYLGGPNDKITTFVRAEKTVETSKTVPEGGMFSSLVPIAEGRTAGEIMDAIYEGAKLAYRKRERRFMELSLEDISPYTIGEFFQFKMLEIMYLGSLLNINTFNQPHVELYKKETKRILEG